MPKLIDRKTQDRLNIQIGLSTRKRNRRYTRAVREALAQRDAAAAAANEPGE